MYVTEYRKALRDAGFDGFRVVLFQQTGGLKQATGEESGLDLSPKFFWGIVKAIVAGDVLNAMGYRLRPYEVTAGDTDRAIEQCKKIIYEALENKTNIMAALWKCKPIMAGVKVDKTLSKPKVSIIGEFWAMTTEGDGNYQLQRFLESEGAEADIQLVTAWLLYTVWEGTHDTKDRADLRGADSSKYGLGELANDSFGVAKKLAGLNGAAFVIRALFQTFAHAMGLYGYKLPNMDDDRRDQPRVLQQRSPWRRGPHGGRQADHEHDPLEGAHDAQREALRLHAQRGRLRRRAVGHHREVPRDDLLSRRDERRRPRELLLARADVPLQGQAGANAEYERRSRSTA
jgi:hypothetical protein